DRYVPTPCLCWAVARDEAAIGGLQLTASHNPAQWLGIKVRMSDGGASGVEFTRQIEDLLPAEPATDAQVSMVLEADILSDYLDALRDFVDTDAIAAANLKLVIDPLYGASRVYLAELFEQLGVEVVRIHDGHNATFGGLHPEPIPPWTDAAAAAVTAASATAGFVLDGDADRLGALDQEGDFVSSHKIIALLALHMAEQRGKSGRIVKALSTSFLVDRVAAHLGMPLTTTPVGFKWIYQEMLAGDVMIGGEESGGIGIPSHVRERDGLLMSLLLAEMMAQTNKSLRQLVADLEARVGALHYDRRDLTLDPQHIKRFRDLLPTVRPSSVAGTSVAEYVHVDGAKFLLNKDEWLLLRASGTEPLVRIYAEAATTDRVAELLAAGEQLVQEAA
ncbi:MAG: phosphoglucosamine mutase, partial [Coriobacteriia bacterium]|nr:phosphoglucosamine mutase [Coriobacteriia bacterium]